MKELLIVFAGGGIGAAGRYWLAGLAHRTAATSFPVGTMAVNVLGCLLIGLLMGSMEERFLVQPSLRLFLTAGILGGFTTFSSFSYETIALFRDGELLLGLLNAGGGLFFCLLATALGAALARLF